MGIVIATLYKNFTNKVADNVMIWIPYLIKNIVLNLAWNC